MMLDNHMLDVEVFLEVWNIFLLLDLPSFYLRTIQKRQVKPQQRRSKMGEVDEIIFFLLFELLKPLFVLLNVQAL